jgi:hypothetical protein
LTSPQTGRLPEKIADEMFDAILTLLVIFITESIDSSPLGFADVNIRLISTII